MGFEIAKPTNMNIIVNGNDTQVQESICISDCMEILNLQTTGIALAVNNEVVPKNNWDNFILKENDKLLIIRATSGG